MSTALYKPAIDENKMRTALEKLKHEANTIVVDSAEACLRAKTGQRDIRAYLKDAHAALDPFVNLAKRNYDEARDERGRWILPGEAIDEVFAGKVKNYERQEREKALREQEEVNRKKREAEARIAEEHRKAAAAVAEAERKAAEKALAEARKAGELKAREYAKAIEETKERERRAKEQAARDAEATKANFQPVEVLPNIPVVAGVPSRRNFYAEFTDFDALLRAYAGGMRPDLRKFIMGNEQELGKEARFMKDPVVMMARIPGIRAWEE